MKRETDLQNLCFQMYLLVPFFIFQVCKSLGLNVFVYGSAQNPIELQRYLIAFGAELVKSADESEVIISDNKWDNVRL